MKVRLNNAQVQAMGWLLKDLGEHETAVKELSGKISLIFNTWWAEWSDFDATDLTVEVPDMVDGPEPEISDL